MLIFQGVPSMKLTANAPENGWLGSMRFLLGGWPILRCELLAVGSVEHDRMTWLWITAENVVPSILARCWRLTLNQDDSWKILRVTYFQVVVLGMVHDNLVPETSCKMVVSFGWQTQFITCKTGVSPNIHGKGWLFRGPGMDPYRIES